MNRLSGIITALESNAHLSLVDILVGEYPFTAMLMETPADSPYLQVGKEVAVLFKETEVSLAKDLSGKISLRNRIKGTVHSIRSGEILSEITIHSHNITITSIITSRAVKRLELIVGDEVEALVKANEVSLMERHDGL